jgi:hypothetical protein
MIRTLLLAVLVAVAVSQQIEAENGVVDQAEWFSWRMGQGPFCDSACIPDGNWNFRRDWWNLESANEEKYLWWADGPEDFWEDRSSLNGESCGDWVNDLVTGREFDSDEEDGQDDEDLLLGCQPGIIYFFRMQVYYDHEVGKLEEKLFLSTSFHVSSGNWDDFVRDYFDLTTAEKRTQPWDLLRMSPSAVGTSRSGEYFQKVMLTQEFIANYERNCCTFVGSVYPIYDAVKCDFADFDSDVDSDDIGYPTYWFCDYLLGHYDTVDFELNCGDSDDSEDCQTMLVENDDRRRQFLAGDKLRQVMYGARSNGPVEKITRGDYKKKARTQYDYTEQPIPDFGGVFDGNTDSFEADFWNPYWDDAVFYYVPYTSSITAPYCGYKYGYK